MGQKLYRVEVTRTMIVLASSRQEAESVADENEREVDEIEIVATELRSLELVPTDHRESPPWPASLPEGTEDLTVAQWAERLGIPAKAPKLPKSDTPEPKETR